MMHGFQQFVDTMSDMSRRTRSDYHVTLSALIDTLANIPEATPIKTSVSEGVGEFDSYRGYYADLALSPSAKPTTVGEVLKGARASLDNTFMGYKGGDYTMGPETPLWVADYGCCGPALIRVDFDGEVVTLVTKEIE